MHYSELNKELGNIDLYLLDHILKGRFEGKKKILDAGCGEGRNLRYFVNNGFEVYGLDNNPLAIQMARMTYRDVPDQNWKVCDIEKMDWEGNSFDAVICNAVLHFSRNESHFFQMIEQLSRVLKSSGLLFIRVASTIGLNPLLSDTNGFNYRLSQRNYESLVHDYGLIPIEPLKTVVVDQVRSMTALSFTKN